MFIQTEATPNPATLKFIPGREVSPAMGHDFPNPASAAHSPLAQRLFAVGGVGGVYLGSDFITVTKTGGDWAHLKPALLAAIMDHFVSGAPVFDETASLDVHTPAQLGAEREEDVEIINQIKELLDTRVRPAVAQDGGDIVFRGYDGGVVYLHMQGSCAGCPSSTATLKSGVENLLRHYIPEVEEVRAV
jgi:Fe-S cluster biogenesis protein NfuA